MIDHWRGTYTATLRVMLKFFNLIHCLFKHVLFFIFIYALKKLKVVTLLYICVLVYYVESNAISYLF